MAQMLNTDILQFNPTTVEDVRKVYNLDKPGVMEQAINILDEWIQKQDHFVKKDFRKGYLERVLISTKGSIEKAKTRVDKICTMRSMVPNLFAKCDIAKELPKIHEAYLNLHMPKLTEDNNRVYIAKVTTKKISPELFLQAYQHSVILSEYMKLYDYSHGCHVVADLQDVNIIDLVSQMNLIDFRNTVSLYIEGYGFGVKGIYIISTSKMIDAFISIVKQVVSPKISQRIRVLKNVEALHKHIPKYLLPEDYGGSQKSLAKLYDEWTDVLSSAKHVLYTKEMSKACTDEGKRRKDKFNDDNLGMPGSFKILSID